MAELTQERLRAFVHYCPETGKFTRIKGRRGVGQEIRSVATNGYLMGRVDTTRYLLHRLAWLYVHGCWPGELDHINRDKADNRISNLREATRSQNNANSPTRAVSGFRGVVKVKWGFRASATVKGKFVYLGLHETAEQAHAAYLTYARGIYGKFASAA